VEGVEELLLHKSEKLIGVLRLRDVFAARSRHFAQDDQALKDAGNPFFELDIFFPCRQSSNVHYFAINQLQG
jgi:hypothetical protein